MTFEEFRICECGNAMDLSEGGGTLRCRTPGCRILARYVPNHYGTKDPIGEREKRMQENAATALQTE